MTDTTIPLPQTAVTDLRSTLTVLVNALLAGTEHARWYADHLDEDIDRALSPALVRKGAKRHLLAIGEEVENEEADEDQYQAEYLPNLGLCVVSNGFRIRVLRSDRGMLPVPGVSKRRQDFYAQQGTLDFGDDAAEPEAGDPAINLVLHWSTDDEYCLEKVYLACPRSGGTTRASVEAHWDELIWRRHDPAITGVQVQAVATDLDIYLDEPATGTNE